jgi:hypothetical protein
MRRVFMMLTLAGSMAWSFQGIDNGSGYAIATMPLRREGIPLRDQAALIKTLNRRDKPALAAGAAYALGTLPKNDLVIRELNFAALSDSELLMTYAIDSLVGFGDVQWVNGARARLPNMKKTDLRLVVARQLARAGVFDGWDLTESTIMTGRPVLRDMALNSVDFFRNMKDASGQPVDLVKKLDAMRSSSSSKAVRDALLTKIIQLTVEPPAPRPPRKKQ